MLAGFGSPCSWMGQWMCQASTAAERSVQKTVVAMSPRLCPWASFDSGRGQNPVVLSLGIRGSAFDPATLLRLCGPVLVYNNLTRCRGLMPQTSSLQCTLLPALVQSSIELSTINLIINLLYLRPAQWWTSPAPTASSPPIPNLECLQSTQRNAG